MSKNKTKVRKQAAKRRAAKARKRRDTRKAHLEGYQNQLKQRRKRFYVKNLLRDGDQVPDITDEEYLFWLCHGINFLMSNDEEGIWDPMFDGIYEGQIPSEEQIVEKITKVFDLESEEPLTTVGQAVVGWSVSERNTIRIFKFEAERRIREKFPELDAAEEAAKPHNPVVWSLLSQVTQSVAGA